MLSYLLLQVKLTFLCKLQRFTRCDVHTCYLRADHERLPKQKHAETAGSHVARSRSRRRRRKRPSLSLSLSCSPPGSASPRFSGCELREVLSTHLWFSSGTSPSRWPPPWPLWAPRSSSPSTSSIRGECGHRRRNTAPSKRWDGADVTK